MILTGKTQAQVDQEELDRKKAELLAAAEVTLQETLAGGFLYQGHTWQADDTAQRLALATIVMSASDPTVFPREWRNAENQMITFDTTADFGPFVAAMKTFVDGAYATVFARKDAVRACTTLSELEAL